MRKTSLVPVISDFLFDDAGDASCRSCRMLNSTHDVFLVLIDSAFAFELPAISAGWIETVDVETGTGADDLARAYRDLAARARALAGRCGEDGERAATSMW